MSKDTDFFAMAAQNARDEFGQPKEGPMDATVHYLPTPLVLVVDDDIGIRQIAEALARHGMTVVRHEDGKRARITLTDEGLRVKQARMEAARHKMLERGMEP